MPSCNELPYCRSHALSSHVVLHRVGCTPVLFPGTRTGVRRIRAPAVSCLVLCHKPTTTFAWMRPGGPASCDATLLQTCTHNRSESSPCGSSPRALHSLDSCDPTHGICLLAQCRSRLGRFAPSLLDTKPPNRHGTHHELIGPIKAATLSLLCLRQTPHKYITMRLTHAYGTTLSVYVEPLPVRSPAAVH